MELKNQNEMLLSQLENVSSQSKRIQEIDYNIPESGEVATGEDGVNKKYQDMVEIVRFVRREKDILQCQYDLLDHESKKYRSKCEHLQKSLDQAEARLKEVTNEVSL